MPKYSKVSQTVMVLDGVSGVPLDQPRLVGVDTPVTRPLIDLEKVLTESVQKRLPAIEPRKLDNSWCQSTRTTSAAGVPVKICAGYLIHPAKGSESARRPSSSSAVASSTADPCLHATITSMFIRPIAELEHIATGNAINAAVGAIVENAVSVCDDTLVGKKKSFLGFWRH